MATINLQQNDRLLRTALRGNGVFSIISGAAFILLAQGIAEFLGVSPDAFILIALVGLGLLGYAAALLWYTGRADIPPSFAMGAVIADALWVIGSIALLIFDPFNFSTAGRWAVLIIADAVGVFAILQYVGLRRSQR
jgi:hypothetical protein